MILLFAFSFVMFVSSVILYMKSRYNLKKFTVDEKEADEAVKKLIKESLK